MRVLRKMIVLGLAGLGVYKAWELVSPKIGLARDKTAEARDRVEPALRDAANTVRTASRDAVASVGDASADAAETVTQAVVDLGHEAAADTKVATSETPSERSTSSDVDAASPEGIRFNT